MTKKTKPTAPRSDAPGRWEQTTPQEWRTRAETAEAKVAALQAELERLRARPATGRPAATANEVTKRKRKRRLTPDELSAAIAKTKLVDLVCARLGLTRAELAARLDVQQTYLSPSRTLPKRAMEMLLEMAGEGATNGGEKK